MNEQADIHPSTCCSRQQCLLSYDLPSPRCSFAKGIQSVPAALCISGKVVQSIRQSQVCKLAMLEIYDLVQEAGQADTTSVEEEREAQEEVERLDSGVSPGFM